MFIFMEGRIRRPGEMPEREVTYYINGDLYLFTSLHYDFGVLRGYSHKRKKWAELEDKYIQFDNEGPVFAVKGE